MNVNFKGGKLARCSTVYNIYIRWEAVPIRNSDDLAMMPIRVRLARFVTSSENGLPPFYKKQPSLHLHPL